MGAGLFGALGAAVAYGTGSVLQDVAARRTAASPTLDPRLLLRLARQAPYVAGLGLDLAGFALSVVALRTLPLFAVQAAVASSIGVTALLAAVVVHEQLSRYEWSAVAGIGAGLAALALAAAPESSRPLGGLGRGLLVVAVVPVALGALVAARGRGARTGVVLGGLAGLAYGGVGIAARVVRVPHPLWHGLADPVVWALVAYGLLGTLVYATALQRGAVTSATAALFAAETVVPAAIGLAFLGDAARPSYGPVAGLGFAVTVGAALVLARYAG